MMANSKIERVLGRRGARTLTPEEIAQISGADCGTNTQLITHTGSRTDVLFDID
jgi:hypothetical protein